jgi:hypothetical protein
MAGVNHLSDRVDAPNQNASFARLRLAQEARWAKAKKV